MRRCSYVVRTQLGAVLSPHPSAPSTCRFMHTAGVVHRDLKPSNLLVGRHKCQPGELSKLGLEAAAACCAAGLVWACRYRAAHLLPV